jgi:hypothetical protein
MGACWGVLDGRQALCFVGEVLSVQLFSDGLCGCAIVCVVRRHLAKYVVHG